MAPDNGDAAAAAAAAAQQQQEQQQQLAALEARLESLARLLAAKDMVIELLLEERARGERQAAA